MSPDFRKQILRFWELKRIPFNSLILVILLTTWPMAQAFTAGIDDKVPASLLDPMTVFHIGLSFAMCNVCYSIVYALEFYFHSSNPNSFWVRRGRWIVFCAGCIFVVVTAGPHFSALSFELASRPGDDINAGRH